MSEISEEDSIKISVNVARLSEGVSKISRYLSFQDVFCRKSVTRYQAFDLKFVKLAPILQLLKIKLPGFQRWDLVRIWKIILLVLKVKLTNDFQRSNWNFQKLKLRFS